MMWTFFGIVALILAINLLAFVLVMRLVITRMMKSPQPAGPNGKGQADRIWGTLTIFLVLGLTWLTGILYAVFGSTSLAFVFILTNSLQGVWIFIFGIVMNRRVRGDAVKLMLSWRKGRYEIEPSVRFTTSHTIDSQVDAGK
ncbi:adhesion G protein-coupled receptor L4-like [Penaeus chinensis]|uniref:adhesion G protein-coupled receptor L4-like n=1 Tax=Penaeus chinensis TaxID=139456 RepID=UPI001FB5F568|nr:adhesion G protein-coupled receptor L4-like [Penaeus chinensis]